MTGIPCLAEESRKWPLIGSLAKSIFCQFALCFNTCSFCSGIPVSVQGEPDLGLSCNVAFAFDTIGANESRTLETEFYVGPKEYKRLQGLGNYQDKVMQFGWFSFFSKLLLYFMSTIHSLFRIGVGRL